MPRHVDCKQFREQHALFVDLRCSAIEENEMRQHLRRCPGCARHDMIVRRSLMLVKSLPTIEPSPDFQARLEARLRTARFAAPRARSLRLSYVSFAALAATLALFTVLGIGLTRRAESQAIRM